MADGVSNNTAVRQTGSAESKQLDFKALREGTVSEGDAAKSKTMSFDDVLGFLGKLKMFVPGTQESHDAAKRALQNIR